MNEYYPEQPPELKTDETEAVERAAKAMFDANVQTHGHVRGRLASWQYTTYEEQNYYRTLARAALNAAYPNGPGAQPQKIVLRMDVTNAVSDAAVARIKAAWQAAQGGGVTFTLPAPVPQKRLLRPSIWENLTGRRWQGTDDERVELENAPDEDPRFAWQPVPPEEQMDGIIKLGYNAYGYAGDPDQKHIAECVFNGLPHAGGCLGLGVNIAPPEGIPAKDARNIPPSDYTAGHNEGRHEGLRNAGEELERILANNVVPRDVGEKLYDLMHKLLGKI
jgi:hypothetical protein